MLPQQKFPLELCFEIPLFGSALNKFAEKQLHTTSAEKKAFKDPDIPAGSTCLSTCP